MKCLAFRHEPPERPPVIAPEDRGLVAEVLRFYPETYPDYIEEGPYPPWVTGLHGGPLRALFCYIDDSTSLPPSESLPPSDTGLKGAIPLEGADERNLDLLAERAVSDEQWAALNKRANDVLCRRGG